MYWDLFRWCICHFPLVPDSLVIDHLVALILQGRSWNAGGCCGYTTDERATTMSSNMTIFLSWEDYTCSMYVKNTMPRFPYHNFEVDMERIC